MFFRLLLSVVFLFSVVNYSFAAVKNLGSITPVAYVDALFVLDFHKKDKHVAFLQLEEAVFGMEIEIKDNVLLHADLLVTGDTLDNEVEVLPGTIFGEVTFSKTVPIYLKVGKYRLSNIMSRPESLFLFKNNFLIEASLIDTLAFELGYKYADIVHIGAGVYYVENRKDKPEYDEWIAKIDNYFVYANFKYKGDDVDLVFNLGFTSNIADSPALGKSEENLSNIYNATAEFMIKHKTGHFLLSGSFPQIITVRFEGAYEGDILIAGLYTAFRFNAGSGSLTIIELPNDGGTDVQVDFKPPVRIGAMFAFKVFEGIKIGLEAFYDIYLQIDKGYDANLTLSASFALPDYTFYF